MGKMRRFLLYGLALVGLTVWAQPLVTGDVTGDGVVDIADVNAVINMMLGKAAPATAADVTGDGVVDIADVNAVINMMLGKIQPQDVFARLDASMVLVNGGTFDMGTPTGVAQYSNAWERPVHIVTLTDFYVCKYEVTQELWQAVMDNNPSAFEDERRPVEMVSWNDAQTFVLKLSEKTGKPYRLLTEAEWEYAARGGQAQDTTLYAGDNNLSRVAWYSVNAGDATHEVGKLQPNALGLYDMSGNVLEWVEDTHQDAYGNGSVENPLYFTDGFMPVVRGGSWRWGANYCRVGYRGYFPANTTNNYLGLRLARSVNP